jgi:hypothetical protein
MLGVAAVALAAHAGNLLFDNGPLDLLLLVLLTMALLAGWGVLFVIEKDDKLAAWARVKTMLSMRKTV